MQITFNSYEEMVEFMEKIQESGVKTPEPAAPAAEGAERVPHGHQITRNFSGTDMDATIGKGAPVQSVPAPPVSTAPVPAAVPTAIPETPSVPVQNAVPTSRHEYTMDELAKAAMTLLDKGGMGQLQQLLAGYKCESLQQLPKEQYGSFATALRGMGAQI